MDITPEKAQAERSPDGLYEYFSRADFDRVLGEHPVRLLSADCIVTLPQVRTNKNSKTEELADSIDTNGLINQVDVALMAPEQLAQHLDFINHLWKTNVNLGDYGEPTLDGYYPVLIAGHSRLAAIKLKEEQTGRKTGLFAKIYDDVSSGQFITLQLAENIHEEPREEDRAVAIVESYRYGMMTGKWSSPREFLAASGNEFRFNKKDLEAAIAFSELPQEIRDRVPSGMLYYESAVGLGKNLRLIREYEAYRLGKSGTPEEIEECYCLELLRLVNSLSEIRISSKGTPKKARQFLNGQIKSKQDSLASPDEKAEEDQTMLSWFGSAPDRQRTTYLSEVRSRYRETINELSKRPTDLTISALELDTALRGIDHSSEMHAVRRTAAQHLGRLYQAGIIPPPNSRIGFFQKLYYLKAHVYLYFYSVLR